MRESQKTKCLILHGFGGGVHEVEPLAKALLDDGYEVFCPTLKGHSGTRKEMTEATYQDWIDSAEKILLESNEPNDKFVIIGFSMGGLIAFHLASKYPFKNIVTINTPTFWWNLNRVFLNLIDDLRNRKAANVRRYLQAKNNSPVRSMIQFLLLLKKIKPELEKVNCPILVIQAEDDDAVRLKSVGYIMKNVKSKQKKVRFIEHGGHLILLSPAAEQVTTAVKDFLKDQQYK
ncbi:MAG: alpha/beta fold hydrolase [Eubacteriaceae bacterium]|nr:alpha/beta fold hydrolase [Eubacteriaceae bacterium]